MNTNMKAFLDMIAWAEIGKEMLAQSTNGYNVLVGSLPGKLKLFHDYSDHPRILVKLNSHLSSSAAGRYQILKRTFDHYKKALHLPDFSPDSQDKIAIRLITEQGALHAIETGNVSKAIDLVSNIWASLPGAGYGQREHKIDNLITVYSKHGGSVV